MRLFLMLWTLSAMTLCWPGEALAKRGPSGTFANDSGKVTLRYVGEGTVEVKLKTKYCSLDAEDGGTFVFPQGIHVMNKKREPVLVIFYSKRSIVVYAEMTAFKKAHCKGGLDATGVYKRARR